MDRLLRLGTPRAVLSLERLTSHSGGNGVLLYHGASDAGCVRQNNEDRILSDTVLGLFAVADGMGGHRHGQIAAELAICTLRRYLESSRSPGDVTWPFGYNWDLSLDENRLITGILLANRHVWKRSEEHPEYAGMGSTVVAVLIADNRAAIANIGDSRAYLYRGRELRQLTIDDTWLNTVVKHGTLDAEALMKHPMRNVLTQAAGTQRDLDVHTCTVELEDADALLLCSDGLHSVISDDAICAVLGSQERVEQQVTRLTEAALSAGAPDNVSCILLRYEEGGRG
jgi:PPM family protein phosphatase